MNYEYISPTKRNELNKGYADWSLRESINFTKNYNVINNPLDYINNNTYFLTVSFDFRRVATESRHSKKKLFKNNFKKNNKRKNWKQAYREQLKKFNNENSLYNALQFHLDTNTGKLLLDYYNGIFNKLNRITNNVRSYNNLNNVMFHAVYLDVAGTRYSNINSSYFYPHLHVFILLPPYMKISLEEAIDRLNKDMNFKQNYTIKNLHLEKIKNTKEDNDKVRSYISKFLPLNGAIMRSEEDIRFYPSYRI